MNLETKRNALYRALWAITSMEELDGDQFDNLEDLEDWEIEYRAEMTDAKTLLEDLIAQTDSALLHRDVTRMVVEKNPGVSLADCRKHATKMIQASKENN